MGSVSQSAVCLPKFSFMYVTVRVISYIAENDTSWEKESGSVAKLWASNIRFGYCTILTVTVKLWTLATKLGTSSPAR